MSAEGVIGASWLPTDGYLDPSLLTYALAEGAREAGATIRPHTRVTGIDVRGGVVRGVSTERGDVECEVVVNAGGMYAAEIGRMAGVRVPVVPMAHQYLVTQPFRERDGTALPTLRDPDHLIYFREEGGGLVMGGYERDCAAVEPRRRRPRARRDPARLQRPPARGGLGPPRGDRGQLAGAGARDGGRADHEAHQRPGGVHAGRGVLPRRDRGPRAVRGGGLLRPRPGGRRRRREGGRGVDRRPASPRSTCGTWTSAASAPTTARRGTRSRGPARCTRPTTTSSTPTTSGRPGARCGSRRSTAGTASTARCSARSPAGSA